MMLCVEQSSNIINNQNENFLWHFKEVTLEEVLTDIFCLILPFSLYDLDKLGNKTVPRAKILGPFEDTLQFVVGSTISLTCTVNLQASLILWWGS